MIISLGQTFQASTSLTEGMKIKLILDEEVETTFKALTTCLQFVGLYVPPGRRHCQAVAQWICSVTFLALGWFNAARFCIIFGSREGFTGSLMAILSYFICFLGSAYMSTALLYACTKHMDPFLKDLSDYKKLFGLAFNLKKLKLWIVISLSSIGVYGVFAFTLYVVVYTVFTQSNFNDVSVPFDKVKGISRIFGMIFISATHALSTVPLFIVLVFVSSCCYILGKEYDAINSAVIQMGNDKDTDVKCESIRHQHTVLTRILDKANHMITHFLFSCCAVWIPVICFLVNGLVRGGLTTEEFLAALVTATSGISSLFMAFITSANLSVKAHGCLDDLLRMDMSELSPKTLQIVSIFANRLAGPPIGYTVYGLFTVDGSTVLTIIGTLLTYAVIILQLAPEDTPPVVTNVTTIPFLNTTA